MLTTSDASSTQEQLNASFRNGESIDFSDVQLEFESEVWWDLDAIAFDFACWMAYQHRVPASTSQIGILSSSKFECLLDNLTIPNLRRAFKLLVESSSVLYNHEGNTGMIWKGNSLDDLAKIRSFAGTLVLQYGEKELSNVTLAEKSLPKLKALFLILFGTTIAVGYSRPIDQPFDVSQN